MGRGRLLAGATGSILMLASGSAIARDGQAGLSADELALSVDNMDRTVDPADDFLRYASGGWFDRVKRPDDQPTYGFFQIIADRIGRQMADVLTDAAAQLEDNHAPSIYRAVAPLQQLDAFYGSFDIHEGDRMWLAPEKRVDIW